MCETCFSPQHYHIQSCLWAGPGWAVDGEYACPRLTTTKHQRMPCGIGPIQEFFLKTAPKQEREKPHKAPAADFSSFLLLSCHSQKIGSMWRQTYDQLWLQFQACRSCPTLARCRKPDWGSQEEVGTWGWLYTLVGGHRDGCLCEEMAV